MSDYNSALPVRTENAGDLIVKISDATVPSQQLAIDSNGRVIARNQDGAGNALTSQTNGSQRALDVGVNVAGVQIDPRSTRALTAADVVTANQGVANTIANAWPVKPTDGTNSQGFTATGEAKVSVTQPLPIGTNTIGAVTQASGPWSQNITQVSGAVPSATNGLVTRITNGTTFVDPTQIRTLTTTDIVSANIKDGAGNSLTSSTAGSTRPLDVALRDASGTLLGSVSNPVNVSFSSAPSGTAVDSYLTVASVAAGATSNHDYTVTTGKTLILKQIEASGSGKMKIEVQIETAAASGTFNTVVVQFNSTSTTNMSVHFEDPKQVVAGARVRVIRTNRDIQAQDVYSTIMGQEV